MLSSFDEATNAAGGARSPRPQPLQRQPRDMKASSEQRPEKAAITGAFTTPFDVMPPSSDKSSEQSTKQSEMAPQQFLLVLDDAPRFAPQLEVEVGDEHEVDDLELQARDHSFERFLLKEGESVDVLRNDIMSYVGLFDACKAARASFAIQQAAKGFAGSTQMVDIAGHHDVTGWGPAQLIATIGRFCRRVTAFVNSESGADVTFYGASLTNNSPTISQLKYMDCAQSLQFLTVCCTAEHLNRVLQNPKKQLRNLKFLRMGAARLSVKECTELQAWTHVPHLTLSGSLWSNLDFEKGINIVHDRAQSFTRALALGTISNLNELRLDFKDWVEFESDWDRVSDMIKGLSRELTGVQLSFCNPDAHPYRYLNQEENSLDGDDWADEFDEIQREMCEKFAHLRWRCVIDRERVVLALGTAVGHWNWIKQTRSGRPVEFFGPH